MKDYNMKIQMQKIKRDQKLSKINNSFDNVNQGKYLDQFKYNSSRHFDNAQIKT